MGKAKHKPRPSVPNWAWFDRDGCWGCKNKNNCNRCKMNKRLISDIDKKRRRKKIDYLDG